MSDQEVCAHIFGYVYDNSDSRIVIGEDDFVRESAPKTYYKDHQADLPPEDYFKFCPDCGALLAPIIEEIKIRRTVKKAIQRPDYSMRIANLNYTASTK